MAPFAPHIQSNSSAKIGTTHRTDRHSAIDDTAALASPRNQLSFSGMFQTRFALILLLTSSVAAQVQSQQSHTTDNLRGISIFDRDNIWASGANGTYLMTKDGGASWNVGKVPGAEALDFRGVKAFHNEVFLMSSGTGDKSRIYHLKLGKKWELQFTNQDAKGFFDCMVFQDSRQGVVVGDPVNGKFQILRTRDGGKNWQYIDSQKIPAALDGEGAFAASNSCIAVNGPRDVWFATGGPAARVFHSADDGDSWTVADTPIMHGSPSQGIFSIAFRDSLHGVVVGGDYQHTDQTGPNIATTDDGGKTWKLVDAPQQKFFSSIAFVGGTHPGIVVTGPAVLVFSKDDLHTWSVSLPDGFNAVESKQGVVYAVGANGKVAKIQP
ncbi:MAG TPA: hypothetical protein VFU86_04760 [Terriglobales bacterium]|nr:hypothetical protein [Terriglobales bacterium]